MTTRRGFLGAALALASAPAIVRAESLMKLAVPPRLILWGDGVHDDTEALQALIDGREVVRHDGATFSRSASGAIFLACGTFALGGPITLCGDGHYLTGLNIKALPTLAKGAHFLEFKA